MECVPVRAEEATLLGAVPDEERRPRPRLLRPGTADREQRHAHRRVVVGAVPDRVAVDRIAHAVVILMAAERHVLASPRWISARYLRDDVHRRIREALHEELSR